ncbi:tetraspanin-4-like [Aphis gossypii]|uniref:tetraspanin-4-like n=1 Tax=Aphis gossypii TaxID=80765 RepID=UPI0021592CE4|nr:tetraspanin-4-like [Aphis gossypii]
MAPLSLLLVLILIGEFVLGGIVYHIRSEVEQHALQQMEYTINGYNQTGHETFRQSWNVLQSNIECCGISGPKDWKSVSRSGKLPASCCYALQIDESCTEINSYTNGCYDEFKNSLQHNNRIIFWSALGFALIQISAVILAFYTKCTVANELNEYEKI